jgi:hypothetical protein
MTRRKPDPAAIDDVLRRIGFDPAKVRRDRATLHNPVTVALAKVLKVDLEQARQASKAAQDAVEAVALAAGLLGPLGWCVVDRLPSETYSEAVDLIEAGASVSRVDKLLTAAWNGGVALRGTYGPLGHLYGDGDEDLEIQFARSQLLNRALAHHKARRYEASILILLSQIDGITFDVTGRRESIFYQGERLPYEHSGSLAGLPGNLAAVRDQLLVDRFVVSRAGLWQRHPILHGRELAYGTRINSTKTWALLGGVIDWLRGAKADLRRPSADDLDSTRVDRQFGRGGGPGTQ